MVGPGPWQTAWGVVLAGTGVCAHLPGPRQLLLTLPPSWEEVTPLLGRPGQAR